MRVPGKKTEISWFLPSWEYEATYKASLSKAADILEGIYSRLKNQCFQFTLLHIIIAEDNDKALIL
jgi:hypothetical protein